MKDQREKKPKQKLHNQVTFKPYVQNQAWLLPPSLGELIPAGHLCRLVNDAIDGMNLEPILNTYEGGGSSTYHPRMMLKALVYGYVDKRYSSRDIERSVRENVCYMWLCGMQQPDHNTLNRFRNSQLKQTVKDVFSQVLAMLVEQGYVRLEEYYVDGTKLESVAGRYTYVFAKNTERYKGALLDKIARIIEDIEAVNQAQEAAAAQREAAKPPQPAISDSQALGETIAELNKKLKEQLGENKKLAGQLEKLQSEHLPKLQEYEAQERLLAGRNSYAKTDPDATFMRTKDDHLGNGQLKPCYNILAGTENQFIINCTVHQTPSDMSAFKGHMEDTAEMLHAMEAPLPKRAGGDAGFGSEENYEYLEEKGIEAYLKYPGYYQERSQQRREDPFHPDNLHYNPAGDYYVCPMGQHMCLLRTSQEKTGTGYQHTVHSYRARRCEGCPLRGMCHQAKDDRIIKVNHRAAAYRRQARQRLDSLRGIRMRKQRSVDTEPVFGHIKQCRHFRRFLLTGLDGVATETMLLAIAHNLKKWWAKQCKHGRIVPLRPAEEAKRVQMQAQNSQLTLVFEKIRA
jgi:transposase